MKGYTKFILPYKWSFILAPLMMFAEVIGDVMLPRLVANLINVGIANRDYHYLLDTGLKMLVIVIFSTISGIGGAYFASKASVNFSSDLRCNLFAQIQEFSFKNIDHYSTGSLVTRLTNDIQQVQQLVMMGLRMAMRAPAMLVGALIMAVTMNVRLAIVIMIMIPSLIIVIGIIMKLSYPRFMTMQKMVDRLNSQIQESITNVRVVKSFVREEYEEQKFDFSSDTLRDTSIRAMNVIVAAMPIMMFSMYIATVAVVWYGGNLIIGGSMEVGELTAFTTYIVQILMSLMMLAMVFLTGARAMASFRRIDEVLQTESDIKDEMVSTSTLEIKTGAVEFLNVDFTYENNKEELVLDKINLSVKAGDTLGILGATGSGKTTLIQLIPRLYDVNSGQVLIDGVDVRDYSLDSLRRGIGVVPQKNVLFSGSIKENLNWGNESATKAEREEAMEAAQILGYVDSLELGEDSFLEQGGSNVSGGQKQRLSIARALIKKPKILILDDSTSAVDTATEGRIRECFATTLKDTTKFIISQRISSVMSADQIVVLENGRIIGKGNHKELLDTCEAYQEIYDSQQEVGR